MSRHFTASYPLWISAWAVSYFIYKVLPTTSITKISFQHHAFLFLFNRYRGAGWFISNFMKTTTFFKSAILALLVCVGFVACENNSGEVPEEPETYTVKLGWAGEILDISYEPLSTRTATDDLYGIQVYSAPDDDAARPTWTKFAYGVFDDPNNISINLLKGYKYKFVATMIKDGKIKTLGVKNSPFYIDIGVHSELNKFTFSSEYGLKMLGDGATYLINPYDLYHRPNVVRFYGELVDYVPSEGANAKIDMKRTVFGAKFIAGGELAVDGKLEILIAEAPKMELTLTEGDDEISDIFTFDDVRGAWAKDDYSENVNVTLNWVRADGVVSPLGTHKVTFKRNTTTIVEVNIDNVNSDEALSLNISDSESGDLVDGDTIVINDGELVETEIETGGETN